MPELEGSGMTDEAAREKWDRRYGAQAFDPHLEPIPFLRDHLDLSTEGRALCLAAGNGRNAVYLAERGFQVDAVDISAAGLRLCRLLAETRGVTLRPILADLEDWPMGEHKYDLITKFYYYQPQLFERIRSALRPGGRLMFQTFSQGQLAFPRGPRNPDHLAKPEDILPRIRGLRLRFYEDRILGPDGGASSGEEAVTRFIAEKERSA